MFSSNGGTMVSIAAGASVLIVSRPHRSVSDFSLAQCGTTSLAGDQLYNAENKRIDILSPLLCNSKSWYSRLPR